MQMLLMNKMFQECINTWSDTASARLMKAGHRVHSRLSRILIQSFTVVNICRVFACFLEDVCLTP